MSAGYELVASDQLVDENGPYELAAYIDGRQVHVYGRRGLFVYLAFVDDLAWVTKVPEAWVIA
jgi:hypothetical protein